jgi:hypothetical protein
MSGKKVQIGEAEPEIEITPEMVAAGISVCREHCLGESLECLVEKIYLAMFVEALTSVSASASPTNLRK